MCVGKVYFMISCPGVLAVFALPPGKGIHAHA